MKEHLEQDLLNRYPLLFKRNGQGTLIGGFAVGDGWYDLLNTLCELLYAPVSRAQRTYELMRRMEVEQRRLGDKVVTAVDVERSRLAMAAAGYALPTVVQVKEKFATLRFYLLGASEQTSAYVEFAECMSATMCEECGAPGSLREGQWLRTLCDEHHAKGP